MENTPNKNSFFKKIPGFRSNKWWKKIIACVGYFFIFLIILGIIMPGPNFEDRVNDARKYYQEGNYSMAVFAYEEALENWNSEKDYTISVDDAKNEYAEAKRFRSEQQAKEKSDKLLTDALTAYESGNINEAMVNLNLAIKEAPNYERIKEVSGKMSDAIKKEITGHTTVALEAAGNADIELAEKELQIVVSLDPDNESIETIKKQLNEAQSIINEIGSKPKNSVWDAAIKPVVDYLKANLKDPDSLEFIEWSQVILQEVQGKKYWAVRVKYRAKNSFGGYVVEEKLALIQHDTVVRMLDY